MTPAELRVALIASLAGEWEVADEGNAEFVFLDIAGRAEVGYVHGVAETRTKTLKWLCTVPLAPDPEPETP